MKLLVVDSDCDMVEMLTGWLKTRGYEVRYAMTPERCKALWIEQQPDLVIIDSALEDGDAMALCREMRSKHDALVLALATDRDVRSEVSCLENGADDFLPKPFFPHQLLAHIHALSRRVRNTLERHPSFVTTVGPLKVDALRNEVAVGGRTARLTPTEGKILHLLAANANNVCTLDQIVTHVWGYGGDGDTYLIKAHIRHLREKIEADPSNPEYIRTVQGVGYTLVPRAAEQIDLMPVLELPRIEEPRARASLSALRPAVAAVPALAR